MLSKVNSVAVSGINGYPVTVEVDIAQGLPTFSTVGLPDRAVKEAKERVMPAIRNSGIDYQFRKVTVNLAPADVRKEGVGFDLPIAIGILAAHDKVKRDKLDEYAIMGELALDGSVREVKGALPVALTVRDIKKIKGVILPAGNAVEAAVVYGIEVIPVESLNQTVTFLNGETAIEPVTVEQESIFHDASEYEIDFSEIKGQQFAKRAIEVACAGGHNILMIGPPGSGKTMLAKRIPTVLPPLNFDEAVETTRIHSVHGLIPRNKALIANRPFQSPHHSISDIALIGGGSYPKPGEVSLAHNGVLFLDELPEFRRNVLEVLRQPIESMEVRVSRAASSSTFPANFMLVAAMNPCQCGYHGSQDRECICSPIQVQKYLGRISGPLFDRIDIHIEVPALKVSELTEEQAVSDDSGSMRKRIIKARMLQQERFKNVTLNKKRMFTNAQMNSRIIKKYCVLDTEGKTLLKNAIEQLKLSARAYDRILKVARTIADLDNAEQIKPHHIAEAVQYRSMDRML